MISAVGATQLHALRQCTAPLQVLSNVALRLAAMHEVGFVHRDLKPANIMWLPRENRWTVIDFGCVARVGEVAPLSFTLAYAAPEVVEATEEGRSVLRATEALDAWSLGVMAFELLTGAPAFKFLIEGRAKVRLGRVHAPWWPGAKDSDFERSRRSEIGSMIERSGFARAGEISLVIVVCNIYHHLIRHVPPSSCVYQSRHLDTQ